MLENLWEMQRQAKLKVVDLFAWADEHAVAKHDIEYLLKHYADINAVKIRLNPDLIVVQNADKILFALQQHTEQAMPLAYIVGEAAFWNFQLRVTPDVLIPRADTECLVETALALSLPEQINYLDLGTGSGAIALALAHERTTWKGVAVDRSVAALAVAEGNGERLALNNIEWKRSDWYQAVTQRFDLIVSNPPYIDPQDTHLSELQHEPLSALVAEQKGLSDIAHIIEQAPQYLHDGAYLLLEHGYDQADAVEALLKERGFTECIRRRDDAGQERVSGGRWYE